MFWEIVRVLACSFVAAIGFGALLHAPQKALCWGGIIGAAGYLCYWLLMTYSTNESAAMFVGALFAATCAQVAARGLKMIATVFVTIAIIPLVPGLGLYRAMSAFAQGDMAQGASVAAHTMALILMIALGIAMGTALFGAGRRFKRRMK
ncbi:MAG: threonine/serine exporter family protein [Clostridia bacterium]